MALDLQKTREREEKKLQEIARLQDEVSQLQKKIREAERRADSRRKIILGGVTLKAVQKGLLSTYAVREMIEQLASEKDKETLREFDFGVPETAVSGTPVTASSMDEFEPLDKRE